MNPTEKKQLQNAQPHPTTCSTKVRLLMGANNYTYVYNFSGKSSTGSLLINSQSQILIMLNFMTFV